MTSQVRKMQFEPPPCRYGMGRTFDEVLPSVAERLNVLLGSHGFQVAFRLDYEEKFNAAGAGSFSPYQIWGVCHLKSMYRALAAEPTAGLLFPYHIIFFRNATGETVVMVKDPTRIMDLLRHPVAIEVAIEIGNLLEHLLDEL